MSSPKILFAKGRGGWIAGGFPRFIFKILKDDLSSKALTDYFQLGPMPPVDHSSTAPGDVDFFFSRSDPFPEFSDALEERRSRGGFAIEMTIPADGRTVHARHIDVALKERNTIKIQFVDHKDMIYSGPEECIESFDLLNSGYALSFTDDPSRMILHWDTRAAELDEKRIVGIGNPNTPFLPSRILKYINHRGCDAGLAPDSKKMLSEWFILAATGKWPEYIASRHMGSLHRDVKRLSAIGMMSKEDVVLFLGKWIRNTGGYGSSTTVDWACETLANMSKESEECLDLF